MIRTKAVLATLYSVAALPLINAGWKAVDRRSQGRSLESYAEDYVFAYSFIDDEAWCITASDGVEDGSVVRLDRCDFANAPASQLWHITDDGQFKSKIDHTQCMKLTQNLHQQGRSRVLMATCESDPSLNHFDRVFDQILLQADSSYCVTSQGVTPDPGDIMIAMECADQDRFFFYYYVAPADNVGTFVGLCSDDAYPESGCMVVKGEKAKAGQSIILGNPGLNHKWRYDSDGLFHSALDDTMCMQAGHRRPAGHGTKMRLYPCDKTNPLQWFSKDGVDIELQNSAKLCVGFRGDKSHVDVDPLILKDCDKVGNNWSED